MLQRLRTTAQDESTLFFKSLSLLNNALSAMDVSAFVVDSLKNVVENKLHFPIGQEEILLLLFFTCLKLSLDRNGTAKGIWCPYLGRVKEGKTSCLSLNTETSPRSLSCSNGAQNAHSVPDPQLHSLEETFQWLFFFHVVIRSAPFLLLHVPKPIPSESFLTSVVFKRSLSLESEDLSV